MKRLAKWRIILLSIYSCVPVSLCLCPSVCPFDPICSLHLHFKLLAHSVILSDIPTSQKLQQSKCGGGAVCLICQLISTTLSDEDSIS